MFIRRELAEERCRMFISVYILCLQFMEPEYMNFSPRKASLISIGCPKIQARPAIIKEQKAREKVSNALLLNSDWPNFQV